MSDQKSSQKASQESSQKFSSDQPVAVITGASSGIGKATATALVQLGWQVIGVGRNPERCAAAEAEIRASAANNGRTLFLRADFDRMADVVRVAAEIRRHTDRIDVLINNAGGVRDKLTITPEGTEATFASNHLAPFLLTRELLPTLKATAAQQPAGTVRVIAVSSAGHRMAQGFNWDDLQMLSNPGQFHATYAYCVAKLANIVFTRELAQRAADDGIVAHAMHPGVVASNFSSHGDADLQANMSSRDCDSPDIPAKTLVWMATAAVVGAEPGRYFHNLEEEEPSPQALDPEAARRLWTESEALLAGLGH